MKQLACLYIHEKGVVGRGYWRLEPPMPEGLFVAFFRAAAWVLIVLVAGCIGLLVWRGVADSYWVSEFLLR